jgi:hypothetical protein
MTYSSSCRKQSRILTALFLSCAAASALAASPCCTIGEPGRMTGGGSLICEGPAYRYTFGYEVHCQREGKPISGPNNLEVNLSTGEHFHMDTMTRGFCTGPDATTPDAPFNTFYGTGSGTFNGSPAWIWFNLLDKGEPGAGVDIAAFAIETASGTVLRCSNTLEGGNNQAHRATGNKP